MKRVIIIGGTSGIGKSLTYLYSKKGYIVGCAGRNIDSLEHIKNDIGSNIFTKQIDISKPDNIENDIKTFTDEIGGLDIIIVSSGITSRSEKPDWSNDKKVIDVNVSGFVSVCDAASNIFIQNGSGHIVGISSSAAILYRANDIVYSASKSFVSRYMLALRLKLKAFSKNIYVTEVRPGFVKTPMVDYKKKTPLAITSNKAAALIYKAVVKRKRMKYIPFYIKYLANMVRFLLFICEDFISAQSSK